ncbi:hypothetical protein G6F35_017482 [Rhizopus arrhizus]|nr:hypothetical protein G6F35_017482 [Rhizopus arrhizus]
MPAGNDDGVGSHLGDANPGWHPHPRMARIYPASSRALTSACATTALAHFRTGAPRWSTPWPRPIVAQAPRCSAC